MWGGLPVLTLRGESFASRVAASLLSAIGLLELIAATAEEYEQRAIELALNTFKLRRLKERLDANRLTAPLFRTEASPVGSRTHSSGCTSGIVRGWRPTTSTFRTEQSARGPGRYSMANRIRGLGKE